MFRFYSPPENISEDKIIILDKKEIHHLKNVLRLKKDDLVFVFDGQFNEYETKILDLSDSKITLKIINRRILSKRNVEITVASAIPKGKRFDFVVEKLTELGVNRIIPLKTDRSIVNLGEKSLRFRRWQNIILNSCKQSKRVDFLILEPQIEFKDILKRKGEFHLCLIATLSLPGKNLREILKEKTEKIEKILILIGPEGDFTSEEVNLAVEAGFIPVYLGDLVLRVETAAVVLAGFIRFYYENS